MSDKLIDSHGFSVGRWCFPPFSLRRGECITLCFPTGARVDQDRTIACLTGAESVLGLNLLAKVVFAEPAASPSGWRRWFQNPTPFDWLKRNTTLSEDVIQSFLAEHRMDRRIPLIRYAGTERVLLGLQAAYAEKPDAIVFSTVGLDPMGIRETQGIVAEHLPNCSAVFLAWPFFCEGQLHDAQVFPGSLNVSVIDRDVPLASGIPAVRDGSNTQSIVKAPK